jgi:hypothetical protein
VIIPKSEYAATLEQTDISRQTLAELQRASPQERSMGRDSKNIVSSLDDIPSKSEYAVSNDVTLQKSVRRWLSYRGLLHRIRLVLVGIRTKLLRLMMLHNNLNPNTLKP